MGLLDAPQETTLTRPHRQLIALLEGLGLTVETEVGFPPRSVDCYLPDLHVAVEADGPAHSRAKDRARDDYLLVQYALPVYRVPATDLQEGPEIATRRLLRRVLEVTWGNTRRERRTRAYEAGAGV